eukprot:7384559-Prymnesium_polylepis.1
MKRHDLGCTQAMNAAWADFFRDVELTPTCAATEMKLVGGEQTKVEIKCTAWAPHPWIRWPPHLIPNGRQ